VRVFRLRDFRLLWTGEAISGLGDQFALIALPWLALVLTGSGFALGSVLALMAVPRAALMIVGGAYTDRLSPRRVMLASNAVRLIAVTVLGLAVVAGAAQLWMLYVFALVFGIADAFFFPAATSIVPALVPGEQLGPANAIVQGTGQLTVFVGPALAGLMIAVLGSAAGQPSAEGIGVALLIDAATFVVSLATLWLIRGGAAHPDANAAPVLTAIREGVSFVWNWPSMRLVVFVSMAANLLIVGPFEVGIPVLAYSRLPEGAAAFGLMTSAFGLGSLLGLGGAAALPAPRPALLSTVALGVIAVAGVLLALVSIVYSTIPALALAFLIGVSLGYSNLIMLTWAQRRVPGTLMGRVMSLMMFGSLGLVPVSMFIAGVFVTIDLSALFVVGGVGMAILALASLLSGRIRAMGKEPVVDNDAAEPAAA
jgi:Major Facilitator Superfamily